VDARRKEKENGKRERAMNQQMVKISMIMIKENP